MTETDMRQTAITIAAVQYPDLQGLSYTALNVALVAENTESIYRDFVEPLEGVLARKLAAGVELDARTLAAAPVVNAIVTMALRELVIGCDFTEPLTSEDREQAALYLAGTYLENALEMSKKQNA